MEDHQIIIYQTPDGHTAIDVAVDQDTIWLTQAQIVSLFESSKANISEHIKNIFKTKELEPAATVRKFRTVQNEGKRKISREQDHYNLDMIISLGYRVHSIRGTQFRIWANKVLKEHLVKGYTLNEKRLQEQQAQLDGLKRAVHIMGSVIERRPLSGDEAQGLLRVITDYTYALDILDRYDHRTLTVEGIRRQPVFIATYDNAMAAIKGLREKFGGSSLFGNEKDESFQSSMAAIYQSFGGQELYPSVEEKAAHLLYFVVKNHSFSDGNKRIAAFLFVWFMEKNNILYREDGSKRIADNALVALTLMIAESNPDEKNIITQVVVSLINEYN